MQMTIKKIFEVEQTIIKCGDITAGKLAYGLSRNKCIAGDALKETRKKLDSSMAVKKYFVEIQGKSLEDVEKKYSELPEELKAEVDHYKETEKEELEKEVEVAWYKIPLSSIPGMGEDDPADSGVLPMAYFDLFLEVGIIDDNEPDKERKLKPVK